MLDRVKVVRGDVRDRELLERTLGEYEIDTVFHLAAQTIVGIANRNPVSTFETNIQGTWTLLEACRRSPDSEGDRRRLVRQSVRRPGRLPYAETRRSQGAHPYDVSKSCADLIAQAYAVTYGLPVAITRCGNFYGGGDLNWNRIVPGTIRSVLRGERPVIRSDGQFVRDYFYVEDGAAAYMLLAERLATRPEPARRRPSISPTRLQVTVLELVNRILEPHGVAASSPTSATRRRTRSGTSTSAPKRARSELGWAPLFTLEEGWSGRSTGTGSFLGVTMSSRPTSLRERILDLVSEYHDAAFAERPFVPGETPVPVSGRVFDADGDAVAGRFLARFLAHHRPLRRAVRTRVRALCSACASAILVNSGSSANLLAVTALTSPKLGDRRLSPATKSSPSPPAFPPRSIRSSRTAWCRFSSTSRSRPTTSTSRSSKRPARTAPAPSCSPTRWAIRSTSSAVTAFAARHDLWLIEDCCDAVGSTYHGRKVGTFGDLATVSFYPGAPHHHGRRRLRPHRKAAAENARRVVPRLGPRLLVRSGQGEHLRQALRLAARRAALRLRPQVHLLAHRLQPEDHRHAGRRRRRAA